MSTKELLETPESKKVLSRTRAALKSKDMAIRIFTDKEYKNNVVISIYKNQMNSGKISFTIAYKNNYSYLKIWIKKLHYAAFTKNTLDDHIDADIFTTGLTLFKNIAEANELNFVVLLHWEEMFLPQTQNLLSDSGFRKGITSRSIQDWQSDTWEIPKYSDSPSPSFILQTNHWDIEQIKTLADSLVSNFDEMEVQHHGLTVYGTLSDGYTINYRGHSGKLDVNINSKLTIEEKELKFKSELSHSYEIPSTLEKLLETIKEHRGFLNLIDGPLNNFKSYCNAIGIRDEKSINSLHSLLVSNGLNPDFIEDNILKQQSQTCAQITKPTAFSNKGLSIHSTSSERCFHYLHLFDYYFIVGEQDVYLFNHSSNALDKLEEEYENASKMVINKTRENISL